MLQRVKIFEARSAESLETMINQFASVHVIEQISYHRREPSIQPTLTTASQSLHCCMVLYADAPIQVDRNVDQYEESDSGLMDLNT